MQKSGLIVVLLCVARWTTCAADLTSSLTDLEQLLETERFLIKNLEDYGNELQAKLNIVRSAVRDMRRENDRSKESAEAYLAIPMNSFSLIRRMRVDWIHWEEYMKKAVGEEQVKILNDKRDDLPIAEDLNDAIAAILRLQATYGLKASDIAVGLLQRRQYNATLTAMDCATIGLDLFSKADFNAAMYWVYAALQLYEENEANEILQFEKVKVLQLYADTMLQQMRTKDALQVIDVALREQPHNRALLSKREQIEKTMNTSTQPPRERPSMMPSVFELGCRGEFSNIVSAMHCAYNTSTTPFLKLAPLKMEIVHLDPYMVLYHDVISDKEIAELKELGRPHLRRATVFNEKAGRSEVVSRRTSKHAWLDASTSNVTLVINRRIADMTGFDLEGSESLQVMNYGLGGHYDIHYDYFNVSPDADVVRMQGNRISTVLFYLSDVEQGGATVFPNLKTAVYPKKGAAIMWYNLNNRGEGDEKTLHAACPVLVGSKWVCNKWIRERSQTFRRPCYKE